MAGEQEFYLSLPSDGSKREYPNNTANSFKIRLPAPISLSGGGWEVGLSSISMPDTKLHLPKFTEPEAVPLVQMKWSREKGNIYEDIYANYELSEAKQVFEGIDGVGFLKSMITFFEQRRLYEKGGPFAGWKYTKDHDAKNRRYIKFKWEGDELVTDNLYTYKVDTDRPALRINKYLAEQMGWIIKHPRTGEDVVGPNLRQELFKDEVPVVPESRSDCKGKDSNGNYRHIFFCSDGNYWRLSYWTNWRFMNLNKAFQSLVGTTS